MTFTPRGSYLGSKVLHLLRSRQGLECSRAIPSNLCPQLVPGSLELGALTHNSVRDLEAASSTTLTKDCSQLRGVQGWTGVLATGTAKVMCQGQAVLS